MNTYEDQIDSKYAFEKAKKEGSVVVFPDVHTLMIDIDTAEGLERFYDRITSMEYWKCFKDMVCKIKDSKTEGHKHIYVTLPNIKLTETQRIFLQLFLGSDPRREFLCLHRILKNDPYPTLFFEKGTT